MLLEQKQFLKGRQSFELLKGEVRISTHATDGMQQFSVELSSLSPRTARIAGNASGPLAGLIIFAVMFVGGVASVFYGLHGERDAVQTSLVLSGMMGIFIIPFAIACLVRWRRMKFDVTTFYSRWNGGAVLSISNQVPNAGEAGEFITELVRCIENAAPVETVGDSMVDQLGRLHELRVKGVLNEQEFASAKARILTNEMEEKRIGFR